MTLTDLIEQLQDLLEEYPALGDRDVMIAQQPSYPLTAVIDCVSLVDSEDADEDYEDDEDDEDDEDGLGVVWIATSEIGSSSKFSPYAPRAAWDGGRS
jgi:hypothetical protein